MRKRRDVALLCALLFALSACSAAVDLDIGSKHARAHKQKRTSQSKGEASASAAKVTDSAAEDESVVVEEPADDPQEVTGSFLTCAFMRSRDAIMSHAAESPTGDETIACGLFQPADGAVQRQSLTSMTVRTRLITARAEMFEMATESLGDSSELSFAVAVPLRYISGSVQLDVRSPTGAWTSYRKSIPTIRSFDAASRFSIEADSQPTNDGWWPALRNLIVAIFGEDSA